MSTYLATFLDDVFSVAAGLFLLTFYFKKNSKLYRKKWVLAGMALLIFNGATGGIRNYKKYYASGMPARERVIKEISLTDTALKQDYLFQSAQGFRMVIPEGYSYKVYQEGRSLIAFKKRGDSEFLEGLFVIGKTESFDDLETAVDKAVQYLVSKNDTYRFSAREFFGESGREGIRMNVSVVKKGEAMKAIMAYIKKPGRPYVYEITLACHEKFWEENRNLFEQTLNTFSLD